MRVSEPLIGSDEGAENLAEALLRTLPKERRADEAVVFVGHGAENPAGTLAYPALQAALWRRDAKAFVGTIEGRYHAAGVLDLLRARQIKTVWLQPLLSVAGEHAANDIFGAEENSWQQILSGAGLTVNPVRRGLLDIPEVAALWADLADEALPKAQP